MMIIENYEEKGLFEHGSNFSLPPNAEQFYITKDKQFFVRPSIWNPDKWVIIPSTPEVAMKINHKRFFGNEEEILNKLKEWTV